MAERLTLVADRFVFEDWSDLQTVVGDNWIIGEPRAGNHEIVIGYGDPALGTFSGNIPTLELETELYKFAVKRGNVELDWAGSFMIEWWKMPVKETQDLLIEVLGFRVDDFIRNPDKQVVGV